MKLSTMKVKYFFLFCNIMALYIFFMMLARITLKDCIKVVIVFITDDVYLARLHKQGCLFDFQVYNFYGKDFFLQNLNEEVFKWHYKKRSHWWILLSISATKILVFSGGSNYVFTLCFFTLLLFCTKYVFVAILISAYRAILHYTIVHVWYTMSKILLQLYIEFV